MTTWGGENAARGKRPPGRRAQAAGGRRAGHDLLLALIWQSTRPQVFGFGPKRLKDSAPPNPSLSGGERMRTSKQLTARVCPAWGSRAPGAVCSSPLATLQPVGRGQPLEGSPQTLRPPHHSSIGLSGGMLQRQGCSRTGLLGSENSQETQNRKQQQQQETEGAESASSLPP